MAAKGKGGSTAAAVWALAEPAAARLGLTLWDVRFVKEGASWYLRIYIDKEGGVGVDDCAEMSHAVDGPLDEADLIEQSYTLEVCSPGLERELTREEHFLKFLGAPVQLRLIRPADGVRDFKGRLTGYENGEITLETEDGAEMRVNKKEASWIRLDDFGGWEA